jgi:hypothetical protein
MPMVNPPIAVHPIYVFTCTELAALRPAEKAYDVADPAVPGLLLLTTINWNMRSELSSISNYMRQ